MRAVVLVGGFGTRLRPLTSDLPKQMLPVVRVPMIERVVAALGSYGVTEAVLSLGYRPDAFIDAYPDGVCAGVLLHYAVEPEPLDTAGAVRFAALSAMRAPTYLSPQFSTASRLIARFRLNEKLFRRWWPTKVFLHCIAMRIG